RRGTKVRVRRAEDQWERHTAPRPAIVPHDLWAAVQRLGGISRGQFPPRAAAAEAAGGREAFPLPGLTPRATGGHSPTNKKDSRSGHAVYKCSWNNERGKTACPNGLSVPVREAEEMVLNTLLCDVLDPVVIIRHMDEVREQALKEAARPEGVVERERLTAE